MFGFSNGSLPVRCFSVWINNVVGQIHVNLNKSVVDLASSVNIFNTVICILTD